ncbi:uncharacterized protein LY89DRAFT_726906 [Mollisia scopiformis]|uniref:Uncharacterized protein n=1 Tax=Mollisia scopiformis TaxID=149040 RepID=A0A194XUN6_MOLSC|nr:uncharacterized protein LY89DRAFT_726906 [Mollisia scopiformis]KUJ23851.1 hypothetical protein LY89DRAFT_726906 [Mollisia scopiformis]
MSADFCSLPSRLSPRQAKQPKVPSEGPELNPRLGLRRATHRPLPESVSPLMRDALLRSSSGEAQEYLLGSLKKRRNRYDEDGRLLPKYADDMKKARSPKKDLNTKLKGTQRKEGKKTMMEDIMAPMVGSSGDEGFGLNSYNIKMTEARQRKAERRELLGNEGNLSSSMSPSSSPANEMEFRDVKFERLQDDWPINSPRLRPRSPNVSTQSRPPFANLLGTSRLPSPRRIPAGSHPPLSIQSSPPEPVLATGNDISSVSRTLAAEREAEKTMEEFADLFSSRLRIF